MFLLLKVNKVNVLIQLVKNWEKIVTELIQLISLTEYIFSKKKKSTSLRP